MQISFRFVPMGTVAPATVTENEIWLDVGNRAAPQVLDHHGGDTVAKSATQLVYEKYQKFILSPLMDQREVVIVLHESPDLDAIAAAWLTKKIIDTKKLPVENFTIQTIVQIVSENDQGIVKTDDPVSCWPIVMRTILSTDFNSKNDQIKLDEGCNLLEETLRQLKIGANLTDISAKIITPSASEAISSAEKMYEQDISNARIFQAYLPQRNPNISKKKYALADGISVTNPKSTLFKELARGDKMNSPQKQGFPLLLLIKTYPVKTTRILQRYIISTNPLTGFHLEGLGRRLEELEQKKEKNIGFPVLPGRERVEKGKGRHGYNVKSPWYDGRGHNFTIVDSPAVTVNGQNIYSSCLSLEQVMKAFTEI